MAGTLAASANAVLCNGLGRYDEARGKVFAKLGIGSRGALHRVLAGDPG